MRKNYPLLLLLVLAGLLLSYQLNKPFIGHHDWNGVFWGSMAREYLRGNFSYFPHYTPLLPLLLSLSGFVFGIHEWSLRLVTVLFSLLMLVAMYNIGKFLYGHAVGLLAVALAMATPMFLYFGKLPDHEPIVTSLITLAFYFYLKLDARRRRTRVVFLAVLAFALLESWASYFLIPFLLLHAALFEKKRLSAILQGVVLGVVIVSLHLFSILSFNGAEGLTNFLHAGVFRLNFDASAKNLSQFTWPQFVMTEARYSAIYFTRILLVLSGIFGVRVIARSSPRFGEAGLRRGNLIKDRLPPFDMLRVNGPLAMTVESSDSALLVLFLAGASFILVFSNLSYIHDYKLYLLLPFVSLASAAVAVPIVKAVQRRTSPLVAYALLLLVILGVSTERLPYLRTLLATSFNAPGYQLGSLIRGKTRPEEKVLVDSAEFASFYEVFVTYYADRPVAFADVRVAQFQEREREYRLFRYLVLIKDRPTDAALAAYLSETYESETDGDFTFFDLQNERKNFAFLR